MVIYNYSNYIGCNRFVRHLIACLPCQVPPQPENASHASTAVKTDFWPFGLHKRMPVTYRIGMILQLALFRVWRSIAGGPHWRQYQINRAISRRAGFRCFFACLPSAIALTLTLGCRRRRPRIRDVTRYTRHYKLRPRRRSLALFLTRRWFETAHAPCYNPITWPSVSCPALPGY
jgi:hypothetical protein